MKRKDIKNLFANTPDDTDAIKYLCIANSYLTYSKQTMNIPKKRMSIHDIATQHCITDIQHQLEQLIIELRR